MIVCDFVRDVGVEALGGFISGVAAGIVVALLAYLFVERKFHLRREEASRDRLVLAALPVIRDELKYAQEQVAILQREGPKGGLPVPLFDVNGWTLIHQAPVLAALDQPTLDLLVKTYNRMRTANDLHRTALDLLAGPSSALVAGLVALLPPSLDRDEFTRSATTQKNDAIGKLVDRATDLTPHLASAVSSVESLHARMQAANESDE